MPKRISLYCHNIGGIGDLRGVSQLSERLKKPKRAISG
jgi:hypothetical protein